MATNKKLKDLAGLPDVDEPDIQETTTDIEESAEVQEIKKIELVLSDAEVSGGTVRLERKGPSDLKWQYCGRFKVEDFSIEHIRQVFGGGDYKAQTFRAKGAFYKKFEFTIDYRYKGSMDIGSLALVDKEKPDQTAMIAASAQANNQSHSMSMMMTMMERASSQQSSQTVMMMNMMNESSKQNIAMMSGMFTALAAAMGKPQADSTSPMMPLLIEMVKSSSGNKGNDISQVISAVRDLSALAKGEPAPKEPEQEDMIDKVMKFGGPIVTALLTKTPLQMPGVAANHGPVIDTQTSSGEPRVLPKPESPSEDPQTEALQKINVYMDVLISAAEKDSEVSGYAQLVSDMLTDDHFDTLVGELQSADWFIKLASGNPRIVAQKEWFIKLRAELLSFLNEQPSADTEPDSPTSEGSGQDKAS